MYEKYWGLNEKPFENTPDPRFIYYSSKHEEALLRLLYAIKEGKGAAMLTGHIGSGKTLLTRVMIDECIRSKIYEVALLTYPQLSPIQFLQEIFYQIAGTEFKSDERPVLLHALQDRIYKNYKEGKKTIVIIDESQIIKDEETFESIRLLLNFQLNDRFLLSLVLVGQPELIRRINEIPQLEQRIGVKYHLEGLSCDEVCAYVRHRLSVAGRTEDIFTKEAFQLICDYSQGIPRKINNICDIALLIGFGRQVREIDQDAIRTVIADLTKEVTT